MTCHDRIVHTKSARIMLGYLLRIRWSGNNNDDNKIILMIAISLAYLWIRNVMFGVLFRIHGIHKNKWDKFYCEHRFLDCVIRIHSLEKTLQISANIFISLVGYYYCIHVEEIPYEKSPGVADFSIYFLVILEIQRSLTRKNVVSRRHLIKNLKWINASWKYWRNTYQLTNFVKKLSHLPGRSSNKMKLYPSQISRANFRVDNELSVHTSILASDEFDRIFRKPENMKTIISRADQMQWCQWGISSFTFSW